MLNTTRLSDGLPTLEEAAKYRVVLELPPNQRDAAARVLVARQRREQAQGAARGRRRTLSFRRPTVSSRYSTARATCGGPSPAPTNGGTFLVLVQRRTRAPPAPCPGGSSCRRTPRHRNRRTSGRNSALTSWTRSVPRAAS